MPFDPVDPRTLAIAQVLSQLPPLVLGELLELLDWRMAAELRALERDLTGGWLEDPGDARPVRYPPRAVRRARAAPRP